jgi:hypothetical protein
MQRERVRLTVVGVPRTSMGCSSDFFHFFQKFEENPILKKKKREFFLIFSLFLIEKSEMEEIKQAVW